MRHGQVPTETDSGVFMVTQDAKPVHIDVVLLGGEGEAIDVRLVLLLARPQQELAVATTAGDHVATAWYDITCGSHR